jgi:hypothetical protein
MASPSRQERESYFLDLQRRALLAQQTARAPSSPRQWAYSFAGKPREFIGEIIGKEWYGTDWMAWRSFVSVVFGQKLESIGEWRAFQHCTSLVEPPPQRPPSVWMPIGRRGGKSRILAAIAVYLGVCYDWSHYLDPGELGVIPVLAADRRQARTIMGYVQAFLAHPKLRPLVKHDAAESIQLDGNILIEVVTASFRAVRSRTVLAALLDEVAFWHSEEESANPDREIVAALQPAMATIPNALLLGASSPYKRAGVLWDNFERYYGKPDGPLIWKAPTRVMNPTVPQAFLNEKYEDDPVAANAEYGAEFRVDIDTFLGRESLDAAITRDVHELPFVPGLPYKAFCDPSGGSSDSFTLAIGHVDPQSRHGVLDVLRERRPPFSPESVVVEFAALLREYRIHHVKGDYYGGEWPTDRFKAHGITYVVAKKRKSDIYLEFLPLVNAHRVELLDERRLYNQLLGLERRTARGGHESIDHTPGSHDDLANVTAGLLVDLIGKRDPTMIDPGLLARSATVNTMTRRLDDLRNVGPRW